MSLKNSIQSPLLSYGDVLLRPLRQDDYPSIYQLRTEPTSIHLWKGTYRVPSQKEFYQDLDTLHKSQTDVFLIISKNKDDNKVFGIVYTYNTSLIDGYTFGAILLAPEYRNQKMGTLSAVLLMQYIFILSPIRKIYVDVVEYNHASLSLVRKLGFVEEGKFNKHRFHNGKYWANFRLAFYREDLHESIIKHIKK